MSLTKVMSKNLITLEIDDDLGKAKAIFDQHNIQHILVLFLSFQINTTPTKL